MSTGKTMAACALVVALSYGAAAQAKGRNTEGTKMTQAAHPAVEVKLVGRHPGRPPLSRLQIDVVLRNEHKEPRWFVLPKDVGQKGGQKGGVSALEAHALAGSGKAVVGRFLGAGGFQAVLLPGGAEVRLQKLPLSAWGEPEGGLPLEVIVASDITVGGESVKGWFGADPTCEAGAHGSEEGSHIIATKKTEGGKELPVAMTEERRIKVQLDLSHLGR